MQIVIDIPDRIYKIVQNRTLNIMDAEILETAVKNGIPLPKGHGRLIDADEIISEATERMKYPSNHEYMECVIAHMNLAPTIIEAEREGKE